MIRYDTLFDQRRKDVSHPDEQTWCFVLGVSITSATVTSNTILDAHQTFQITPHNLVQRIRLSYTSIPRACTLGTVSDALK